MSPRRRNVSVGDVPTTSCSLEAVVVFGVAVRTVAGVSERAVAGLPRGTEAQAVSQVKSRAASSRPCSSLCFR